MACLFCGCDKIRDRFVRALNIALEEGEFGVAERLARRLLSHASSDRPVLIALHCVALLGQNRPGLIEEYLKNENGDGRLHCGDIEGPLWHIVGWALKHGDAAPVQAKTFQTPEFRVDPQWRVHNEPQFRQTIERIDGQEIQLEFTMGPIWPLTIRRAGPPGVISWRSAIGDIMNGSYDFRVGGAALRKSDELFIALDGMNLFSVRVTDGRLLWAHTPEDGNDMRIESMREQGGWIYVTTTKGLELKFHSLTGEALPNGTLPPQR